MDNFDLKKYLAEGRLLREEMELEFFNNDEDVALIANSGEYEAEIKDGKVSFSVVYEDEDDRDGMEFDEDNWKSILGPNHAFVEIANEIPTEVEAIDDYVMITVNLEDLKGIVSLENKILVPNSLIATQKRIQQYMKDGGKGNLNLSDTPITSLPNNLKVGGDLYLENTPITSLPDNLQVDGDLDLNNSSITSLPNDLKVGWGLYLEDTPLSKKYSKEEIEKMIPGVKGEIEI